MLEMKLLLDVEVMKLDADSVVSIYPAKSEGYVYAWVRTPSFKESPADSPASPVQQLKAEIAGLADAVGMPNSKSLMVALYQVANETEQEVRASLEQGAQKTPSNNRSDEIADSIEAACFPEPGQFIMPRESWLREWCRQLRTVR